MMVVAGVWTNLLLFAAAALELLSISALKRSDLEAERLHRLSRLCLICVAMVVVPAAFRAMVR